MQPAGDLPRRPRLPQIRLHPGHQHRIGVDLADLLPQAPAPAAECAVTGPYPTELAPLRRTSRLITDTDRPRSNAMSVNVSFAFSPAAIPARSNNVNDLRATSNHLSDQGCCYDGMTPPSRSR